jgi:hypothetical protein
MKDKKLEASIILKEWEKYVYYVNIKYREIVDERPTIHQELAALIKKDLFNDKRLVQEICKQGQSFIVTNDILLADFCNDELKNDYNTALDLVKTHRENFMLVNSKFRDDKMFILEALNDANVLQYVSSRLKDDSEIVHLSLKKHPYTIKFAPNKFKTDKKLLLELIKERNSVIQFIPSELDNDIDFLFDCWKILESDSISDVFIRNYGSALVNRMNKSLQPLFSQVVFNEDGDTIKKQMNACFNKYMLNQELNLELNHLTTIMAKKLKV